MIVGRLNKQHASKKTEQNNKITHKKDLKLQQQREKNTVNSLGTSTNQIRQNSFVPPLKAHKELDPKQLAGMIEQLATIPGPTADPVVNVPNIVTLMFTLMSKMLKMNIISGEQMNQYMDKLAQELKLNADTWKSSFESFMAGIEKQKGAANKEFLGALTDGLFSVGATGLQLLGTYKGINRGTQAVEDYEHNTLDNYADKSQELNTDLAKFRTPAMQNNDAKYLRDTGQFKELNEKAGKIKTLTKTNCELLENTNNELADLGKKSSITGSYFSNPEQEVASKSIKTVRDNEKEFLAADPKTGKKHWDTKHLNKYIDEKQKLVKDLEKTQASIKMNTEQLDITYDQSNTTANNSIKRLQEIGFANDQGKLVNQSVMFNGKEHLLEATVPAGGTEATLKIKIIDSTVPPPNTTEEALNNITIAPISTDDLTKRLGTIAKTQALDHLQNADGTLSLFHYDDTTKETLFIGKKNNEYFIGKLSEDGTVTNLGKIVGVDQESTANLENVFKLRNNQLFLAENNQAVTKILSHQNAVEAEFQGFTDGLEENYAKGYTDVKAAIKEKEIFDKYSEGMSEYIHRKRSPTDADDGLINSKLKQSDARRQEAVHFWQALLNVARHAGTLLMQMYKYQSAQDKAAGDLSHQISKNFDQFLSAVIKVLQELVTFLQKSQNETQDKGSEVVKTALQVLIAALGNK
jgi:hypothetical protein